jgi:hypothetical protein
LDENSTVAPLPIPPLEESPNPLQDDETDFATGSRQAMGYRDILIPLLVLLTAGFGIFVVHRYSLNDRLPVYLAYQYERRGNIPPRWLKRWVRWTTLSAIERAFQSVNLSLFWLGQPQPAHVTSQERAELLIQRLPTAQDQALSLVREYHNAIYTPRDGNVSIARKAAVFILLKTWQTRIKETLQYADNRYNQLK